MIDLILYRIRIGRSYSIDRFHKTCRNKMSKFNLTNVLYFCFNHLISLLSSYVILIFSCHNLLKSRDINFAFMSVLKPKFQYILISLILISGITHFSFNNFKFLSNNYNTFRGKQIFKVITCIINKTHIAKIYFYFTKLPYFCNYQSEHKESWTT